MIYTHACTTSSCRAGTSGLARPNPRERMLRSWPAIVEGRLAFRALQLRGQHAPMRAQRFLRGVPATRSWAGHGMVAVSVHPVVVGAAWPEGPV